MTPVDSIALVVGIIILVGIVVLAVWAVYISLIGPDEVDEDDDE